MYNIIRRLHNNKSIVQTSQMYLNKHFHFEEYFWFCLWASSVHGSMNKWCGYWYLLSVTHLVMLSGDVKSSSSVNDVCLYSLFKTDEQNIFALQDIFFFRG